MTRGALVLLLIIISVLVFSQDSGETDNTDLAKATQNPLAAMYSLPFQNNTTFGNEPNDRSQNIINIQPVLPFQLNDKVNLINGIILPMI